MNENHGGEPTQPPPSPQPPPAFNPQSVLGTLIVVFGIFAWLAIAVGVGLAISFGACFKQECSPLEEGAPVWAGLLALVLLIPSISALFRRRLRRVHVVLCGFPLALGLVLVLLSAVAGISR